MLKKSTKSLMSSTPILNSTVVRAKFGVVHQMGFARRRILRKIVRANLDPDLGVHAGEFCEQENCARRFGWWFVHAGNCARRFGWWVVHAGEFCGQENCACKGIMHAGGLCAQNYRLSGSARSLFRRHATGGAEIGSPKTHLDLSPTGSPMRDFQILP